MKYKFWYLNEVHCESIEEAVKKDKESPPKFHSIVSEENGEELTPCIGFVVPIEDNE